MIVVDVPAAATVDTIVRAVARPTRAGNKRRDWACVDQPRPECRAHSSVGNGLPPRLHLVPVIVSRSAAAEPWLSPRPFRPW